jgi:hypothetical protein
MNFIRQVHPTIVERAAAHTACGRQHATELPALLHQMDA